MCLSSLTYFCGISLLSFVFCGISLSIYFSSRGLDFLYFPLPIYFYFRGRDLLCFVLLCQVKREGAMFTEYKRQGGISSGYHWATTAMEDVVHLFSRDKS